MSSITNSAAYPLRCSTLAIHWTFTRHLGTHTTSNPCRSSQDAKQTLFVNRTHGKALLDHKGLVAGCEIYGEKAWRWRTISWTSLARRRAAGEHSSSTLSSSRHTRIAST